MARTTRCPGSRGVIPREQEVALTPPLKSSPQGAVSHFASALGSAAAPRSESLPRASIIRRRTVFDATRNKGRRVSNRYMILNFLARDAIALGETGSVAFLTPKRLGPATVRNRLRRRMREIHRRNLAQPNESAYLIWIARRPAVELPFDELRKCMTALLLRR